MTPAERAGLVIGERYVFYKNDKTDCYFDIGDAVILHYDNDTSCLEFKRVSDNKIQFVDINDVKKEETMTTATTEELIQQAMQQQAEATKTIEALQLKLKEEQDDSVENVFEFGANSGCILFSGNKQKMEVHQGLLIVLSSYAGYKSSADFKWVPIKREDLEPGDVAYRTDFSNSVCGDFDMVCAIVDSKSYYRIVSDENVCKYDCIYKYWYKLTPID